MFKILDADYEYYNYEFGPIDKVKFLIGMLYFEDECLGPIQIDLTLDAGHSIEDDGHIAIIKTMEMLETDNIFDIYRYIEENALIIFKNC